MECTLVKCALFGEFSKINQVLKPKAQTMKKLIILAILLRILSTHSLLAQKSGQEFPIDNFVFFPPKIFALRQDISVDKTHFDFTSGVLWMKKQYSTEMSDKVQAETLQLLEQFEENFAKYQRELLPETSTWYDAVDAESENGEPSEVLMDFYQTYYTSEPNKYLLKDLLDIQAGASGVFLWGYFVEQYQKNKRKDAMLKLCFMVVRRGSMKTVYEKSWDLKIKAWQNEKLAKKEIKLIYDKFAFYMKHYYR